MHSTLTTLPSSWDREIRASKAQPPAANRRIVFLAKLDKLTGDLLSAELADSATESELDELRAVAHARLEEIFADAVHSGGAGDDLCTTNKEKSGTQNGAVTRPAGVESDAPLFPRPVQILLENHNSCPTQVHKNVTQICHGPPHATVEALEAEAIRAEGCGVLPEVRREESEVDEHGENN